MFSHGLRGLALLLLTVWIHSLDAAAPVDWLIDP
jgi:hypothetical protein